ncbi:MAG: 2-C-methyl-D-erythritol 4-phosphate cytidylyltransferase [Desulfobacteraceae bacterium]|jgi:2-C-methyl-D-erythritol 4-phosphate cytidylyltransferase|nr:MAG: 2-C-methyl-D-erythritol 4-phosphate cytidylyltransferase [Desulfobacteraceae bacterium]
MPDKQFSLPCKDSRTSCVPDEGEGVVAVIPAAGSGLRLGAEVPKQFLRVAGVPILAVTLTAFQNCSLVDAIVVVVPGGDVEFTRREIVERFGLTKVRKVVPGGERRQDSVMQGLIATDGEYSIVLVHDGVRPLIDPETIARVVKAGHSSRAVTVGFPAIDTVKEVNSCMEVVRTLDRRTLWQVQTPQLFRYKDLMEAHIRAREENWGDMTDDSLMVERMGIPVKTVKGPQGNIKVTFSADLAFMEFLLTRSPFQEREM